MKFFVMYAKRFKSLLFLLIIERNKLKYIFNLNQNEVMYSVLHHYYLRIILYKHICRLWYLISRTHNRQEYIDGDCKKKKTY